eukprot:g4954.t1
MYANTPTSKENTTYHSEWKKGGKEFSVPLPTLRRWVAAATRSALESGIHEHSQVIRIPDDETGALYITDRDVADLDTTKPGGAFHVTGILACVVGKVPAPPCIRGRLWNCSQGRYLKSLLMGVPSLSSAMSENRLAVARTLALTAPKGLLAFDENIYLGTDPLVNRTITNQGVWFTDMSKRPLPFKVEPTDEEVAQGLLRVQALLRQGRPRVLVFVYKTVAERMMRAAQATLKKSERKIKYGMNRLTKAQQEIFQGVPFLFVVTVPGTGWTKQKGSARYCDVEAENNKLFKLVREIFRLYNIFQTHMDFTRPQSEVQNLARLQFEAFTRHARESKREKATQSYITDNQINDIRLKKAWANNLDTGFKCLLYNSLGVNTDTEESIKRYKQFLTRSTKKSLCGTNLNEYQCRYDIQNVIRFLVNQEISKKQISRFGAATARVVHEHWQDLIAKGISKADIVRISSNNGAHVAIKTILEKYDALIGKGFSKADIVCISSNIGANQAIKTILEKYDALIGKGFSKADIVCISSNIGANQAIKTILEKYDALIGKGFSKADIVCISSNIGANQAIKTILEKYDALIGKGFSKADIVCISSNIGANQAIKTILEKYDEIQGLD